MAAAAPHVNGTEAETRRRDEVRSPSPERMLRSSYVAVIAQDSESDFSIYFPDVPGCFTRGATRDQACRFAGEMLALHLGRLATNRLPVPSARSLENIRAQPEHRGATLVLVTPIALAAPPRYGSCSG